MESSFIKDTMLEMTWLEIQEKIDKEATVLFPIAVVEEHGPHLSVSVDIFISYQIAHRTKELLAEKGIDSVIAPPFYWGINGTTQEFPGSFTVSKTTLVAMLTDLLLCLKKWGFKKIITIPAHGENDHILAMEESLKNVYKQTGEGAYMFALSFMTNKTGIKESAYTVIQQVDLTPPKKDDYIDNHAGALETEPMLYYFSDHVREDILKTLEPTQVTYRDFPKWENPENIKTMTPLGYLGDPKSSKPENGEELINGIASLMVADYIKLIENQENSRG